MCGIVGFNFKNEKLVKEAAELLNHRGPDQEGFYIDEQVSLGHKRLSILDLSEKGKQPMSSADNNYVIVFNGEVYNFQEIRENLQNLGHTFTSQTDTEVVLHSYIEWGNDCVNRFNGDFAFCIYDKKKKIFYLARDRFGFKPIYYYLSNGKFIFSSELKVLLRAGIPREIDKKALKHYLFFGFTPSETSIIKGVKKLLPAHYAVFSLENKSVAGQKRYWQTTFSNKIKSVDIQDEVYKLLDDAVKKRMIADVLVGAFLSGGIDSSIICYLMKQYNKELKTFSIKFDYDDFNESKWARIVADNLGTEHHEIKFGAKDVKKFIPDLMYSFDEPFGDPSMIPTFLVSKVAREHVTVCLSGTGADELFIGYPRYKEFLRLNQLNKLPPFFQKALVHIYLLKNKDRAGKLKQLFKGKNNKSALYLKLFSYLYRDDKELGQSVDDFPELKKYFKYPEDLHNVLNFDQNEYIPNNLLVKEDRATMAVSLEGRVPFLDHELVEYVNNLDLGVKFRKHEMKHLLKKIFKDKLPHEILYRKKHGFGVPLKHYFRNELKEFAYDQLFNFNNFDYYDKDNLRTMWNKHQRGESDYSHLFWILISFNMWYKR